MNNIESICIIGFLVLGTYKLFELYGTINKERRRIDAFLLEKRRIVCKGIIGFL